MPNPYSPIVHCPLSIVHSFLAAALIFVTVAGCESNLAVKRMQAKNPLATNSAKTPTKMVDVWNTYAQTMPDGKAVRGVAGRVHFYNDAKKKQSVKVDGDLTVFIFDGSENDPAHAKPLKVYQFKSETLDKHYAFKKPLGHGYDFFMPFDDIGGEEKNLCVMARFDDRLEKTLVLSPPVNTLLKGTKREVPENQAQEFLANNSIMMKVNRELAEKEFPNGIRQVGFENEKTTAPQPPVPGSDRNISTITLSDPMTRRLAQNTPTVSNVMDTPPTVIPMQQVPEQAAPAVPKTDSRYQFGHSDAKFPDTPF